MKSVFQITITVALALIVLKILVILLEPKMTFFPYRLIYETPKDTGIEYQDLSFPTSDGETLNAWFLEVPEPLADLVFFHGNGGNISLGCLDYLLSLHHHGYSVFAFDYRGYGKSTGSPSEAGLYIDSRAAVSYFWENLRQANRPVMYLGHSLGGVAAASAAAHAEPHGLILQGTFPDKMTLLTHYPFFYFLGLFSRYRLSTLEFMKDVRSPVLVVHGERDRVVPLGAGQKLYDRLAGQKELYLVKGAGHADLHLVGGQEYWERLAAFVKSLDRSF
jgi:fermentation-respiration switch protein FrsA (DUF1100 family)